MTEKKQTLVAKIEEEEQREDLSFREWLKEKLNKAFTDNIPIASIKDMGGMYMYIGGVLAYCFFFGCFVYFTWTGYEQARNTRIISLEDGDDNGECENVFRQINGQWLASSNGLFSGNIAFKYPEAKYSIEFQNFQGTIDKYMNVMNTYEEELEVLAGVAVTQDLADNILTWITWQILDREDGEVRRFQMIADATSVFNNEYIFGQISTVATECYVPTSVSSFDTANGLLQNSYSYRDFASNPNCSTIDPHLFGYNERFHGDVFTVGLDVASAVTALGVNKNILETASLDLIPSGLEGEDDYVAPPFVQRIDSRIPGMSPIFCIERGYREEDIVCVLRMGNVYVVPVYNHFGNLNENKRCDCDNMDPYCHVFDFMIGVLYYPYNMTSRADEAPQSFSRLKKLIDTRPFAETNKLAYNASYASVTDNLWQTPLFFEESWREEAYDFCLIDGQYCNVVMFNSYDFDNSFLSSYYYNLPLGSCADSFTADNWETLETEPPIGLVEEYFQCIPTELQAIFLVVGVAAGNCAAFVPIVMVIVLPFVGFYLQVTGQAPMKPEYDEEQLEAATRALALFVLRARDKKMRGIKPKGIINQLAMEMVATAKLESGYSDSDDDSDYDSDNDGDDASARARRKQSIVHKSRKRSSVSFSVYRRDSNLNSVRVGDGESVGKHHRRKSSLNIEMSNVKPSTTCFMKGIDVHILNGLCDKCPPQEQPATSALTALHKTVHSHRVAMEEVVKGSGGKDANAQFIHVANKIGPFNDISMPMLDKEYHANTKSVTALFSELHKLLEAHYSACCFFASDKTSEEKLVPAYIVSSYVFTIYDMEKLACGVSSSPQNVGTIASNCKV